MVTEFPFFPLLSFFPSFYSYLLCIKQNIMCFYGILKTTETWAGFVILLLFWLLRVQDFLQNLHVGSWCEEILIPRVRVGRKKTSLSMYNLKVSPGYLDR